MSSRQPAKASPITGTRITKRGRAPKDAPKDANETPQQARKRALDREAQRNFREKTKNYIAHLEQTVEACKADSESQLVSQLLAENAKLYSTLERLRKVIGDIHTATQPEILERNRLGEDGSSSAKGDDKRDEAGPSCAGAIAEQADSPLEVLKTGPDAPTTEVLPQSTTACDSVVHEAFPAFLFTSATDPFAQNHSEIRTEGHWQSLHDGSVPTTEVDVMMDVPAHAADNLVAFTNGNSDDQDLSEKEGNLQSHDSTLVSDRPREEQFEPSPEALKSMDGCLHLSVRTPMSLFTESAFSFNLWMQTNSIYSQIFAISPRQATEARNSNSGVLFKAIEKGWNSLSYKEQSNPVIQILRGYDDLISKRLDQVNRLAIAYKNHLLIKYFLNRDYQDLQLMPSWQRPMVAQRSKKYPILVDFFAWPKLRERFIRGNIQVECSKFSAAYMRNFRFSWPFSLEDTYQYCPASDTYTASPLFERYHRDLKFWTMEECFFLEFPELTGDLNSSDAWPPSEAPASPAAFDTPWPPPLTT